MSETQVSNSIREQPDTESSTEEYGLRFSGAIGNWFLKVQSDSLKKQLAIKHTKKTIIDFGGGHGQNIDNVLSLGHSLTVLGSIIHCSDFIQRYIEKGDIEFLTGSLVSSSLKDHQFDICLSFRMLSHLDNWQEHIQELCRVGKSTVIIEFPNKKSVNIFSRLFFKFKKSIENNTRPFASFEIQKIEREFAKWNFQLTDKIGQYIFPMVLHRVLRYPMISKVVEFPFKMLGLSNIYGSPLICRFEKRGEEKC